MKRYLIRATLLSAFILLNFALHINAQVTDNEVKKDLKEKLPYLLNTNNAGTLFYLAFHPTLEEGIDAGNGLRIYISSAVATTVTLEIKGIGIHRQQTTKPNDVIQFFLTPSEGQLYTKVYERPKPEKVWKDMAIKITSDDPIICYGMARFVATSDGYLALPASSLGTSYQVSSYADAFNGNGITLNSFTSIIGMYEDTKVTFRMGGCQSCFALKEDGTKLRYNQTITRMLGEGDVWLIPGIEAFSDLSGSTIKATKPINVISGNQCTNIPSAVVACDYIIEQELPENMWGNKYHVTPINTRKNYSIIKIFAKKPGTTIKSDGLVTNYIESAGGIEGTGFIEKRAGVTLPGEAPKPVEITADNPINVVQYNPGSSDDNVENDPFQLSLSPIQQYQTEIVFNTPGVHGQYGFKNNYINIVYKATVNGGIPDDMMWAEVIDSKFSWIKLKTLSGNPGERFLTTEEDGRFYRSKFMKIPYDGVYRLKANDPFVAYAYGSDWYDSYAYPTSVAVADLEKPDSLAPIVKFERDCDGNVVGTVTDEPIVDPPNRSNLGLIFMDGENSYNYKFECDPFIAGTDAKSNWKLKIGNRSLNAQAHLVFIDRAGNRTDTTIIFYAINTLIEPYYSQYGTFKLENPNLEKSVQFSLKNSGDNTITNQYEVYIVLDSDVKEYKPGDITTYQGFEIQDVKGINLSPMAAGQVRKFNVKFKASNEGKFRDSLGVIVIETSTGDTCIKQFFTLLEAKVGLPYITATDKNFYSQVVNTRSVKYDLTVRNPNTGSHMATTNLKITGINFSGDEIGHKGTNSVFEIEGLENISESSPIILEPGESKTFTVSFSPKAVQSYRSVIKFMADAKMPKDSTILEGIGIQPGLVVNSENWNERLVDPNSYVKKGGTYTYSPYISENGAFKIENIGTAEVTLKTPVIISNVNGEAFKIFADLDNDGTDELVSLTTPGVLDYIFENKKVQTSATLNIPVYFDPKISGNHELILKFLSDAPEAPISALNGVGVFPKTATFDIDFGHTIVGTEIKSRMTSFYALKWNYDYPLTITDFTAAPSNPNTTITDFSGNGIFRWDRNGILDKDGNIIALPFTLQPGDSITITGVYDPIAAGSFEATLTSVSDAEEEAVSTWRATAENEGTQLTSDTIVTCVNAPVTLRPKIKNLGSNYLEIKNIRVDGAGTEFSVENPTFTLNPQGVIGDEAEIVIVFEPTKKYNNEKFDIIVHTSSVTKPYDTVNIVVSSYHTTQSSYSLVSNSGPAGTNKSITIDPGQGGAVTYTVFLNTSNPVPLAESRAFEVVVNYNKDFLGIAYNDQGRTDIKRNIGSKLAQLGWSIQSAKVTNYDAENKIETLTFVFITNGPALNESYNDIELMTLKFDSYMPWFKDSDGQTKIKIDTAYISHSIINNDPCVDYTTEGVVVALAPTCVDNIRQIMLHANKYNLKPIAPNPVGSAGTDVNFSVGGNNIFTELKLYNSNSEHVSTLFSGTLNPGDYSVRIPVEQLANGMYFIEMVSGPYNSGYEKLIISK